MISKIKQFAVILPLLGLIFVGFTGYVSADHTDPHCREEHPDILDPNPNYPKCVDAIDGGDSGPGETSLDGAPTGSLDSGSAEDALNNIEDNEIFKRLTEIINFLSIGVGIVATISVAIAGIQYTASRGDPGKTAAAVNRLIQVGIAIGLYVFGYALLSWLIPGGAF